MGLMLEREREGGRSRSQDIASSKPPPLREKLLTSWDPLSGHRKDTPSERHGGKDSPHLAPVSAGGPGGAVAARVSITGAITGPMP